MDYETGREEGRHAATPCLLFSSLPSEELLRDKEPFTPREEEQLTTCFLGRAGHSLPAPLAAVHIMISSDQHSGHCFLSRGWLSFFKQDKMSQINRSVVLGWIIILFPPHFQDLKWQLPNEESGEVL